MLLRLGPFLLRSNKNKQVEKVLSIFWDISRNISTIFSHFSDKDKDLLAQKSNKESNN